MESRWRIYDDLKRDLRGFSVEDFVREFAKAYFEGDVDTIVKLQGMLTGTSPEGSPSGGSAGPAAPDAPVGARIKPRPGLNSGAVSLPIPDEANC